MKTLNLSSTIKYLISCEDMSVRDEVTEAGEGSDDGGPMVITREISLGDEDLTVTLAAPFYPNGVEGDRIRSTNYITILVDGQRVPTDTWVDARGEVHSALEDGISEHLHSVTGIAGPRR